MKSHALRSSLPAGIIDTQVEFFSDGVTPKAFHNGLILSYDQFPVWMKELIYHEMLNKPDALPALISWGFGVKDDQIRQYLLCTRSVLDQHADINSKRILQAEEYVPCIKRKCYGGTCPYEGKICTMIIILPNGEELTPRQVQVTAKIGQDLPDKIICSDLGIKQATLRTHKDVIRSKGSISSKNGIAILANQYNLI